jgi:hypothetical protein
MTQKGRKKNARALSSAKRCKIKLDVFLSRETVQMTLK